jgi:predicted amidohydrolase
MKRFNKSKRKVIVAIAQITYFDSGEKHNVDKIKKYISLASMKGAEIVCFPESCIHKDDVLQFSSKLLKEIQESCKENKIYCIVTDAFKEKGKNYKIALLIDRRGNIISKYKKINIYDDYVYSGKKINVIKTDFAKIGIVVCWDLAFPSLFNRMKEKGAEIVFCPSQWAYESKVHGKNGKEKELKLMKSLLQSRAFENLYFVAIADPVIPNRKDVIAYSAIAGPHSILNEIKDKEGIITADLNLEELKKWKKFYPNKKRTHSLG